MKLPYKAGLMASTLYKAGVSYHDYGTIKQGKTALFTYFKADRITDTQLAAIKAFCPDVQVKGLRSQYAPELTSVAICFPKAAWYRAQVS